MKAFCSRISELATFYCLLVTSLEVISNAISFVNSSTAPLRKMHARVTRDRTKCAKNSTFNGYDIYFDEVNPIPGKRCPVTVYYPDLVIYMAPGRV